MSKRTKKQTRGEQTDTQILGNCWHYFKTRFDKYWKNAGDGGADLDIQTDECIERLTEKISEEMQGDLTFQNWKRAVDLVYPI